LFLGTDMDNSADMVAKGRQAIGDRNGARLHPERLARGDRSGARLHPESRPRGDANGSRLHPESRPRGERVCLSKLTEGNVRSIFHLHGQGWTKERLTAEFGVSRMSIYHILSRKTWKHVDLSRGEAQL
jgi:hypothetical protein